MVASTWKKWALMAFSTEAKPNAAFRYIFGIFHLIEGNSGNFLMDMGLKLRTFELILSEVFFVFKRIMKNTDRIGIYDPSGKLGLFVFGLHRFLRKAREVRAIGKMFFLLNQIIDGFRFLQKFMKFHQNHPYQFQVC